MASNGEARETSYVAESEGTLEFASAPHATSTVDPASTPHSASIAGSSIKPASDAHLGANSASSSATSVEGALHASVASASSEAELETRNGANDSMQITDQPLVSVIVPAYNCQDYIMQCVRSILDQTLADIELICVDDGSTDGTILLLEDLAARDCRMRVLTQPNAGEGAARNAGLDAARGRYLLFADADDYLDRTMLKKMVDAAERGKCDVVICGVSSFDTLTGQDTLVPWGCNWRAFPSGTFAASKNPDEIFRSFQNWTWNKLFSADFVKMEGLRFDEVQRSADLFFVVCALAAARRIRCVPEALYHYRTNNPSSNIATSDRAPLDFYKSLERAQVWMRERGVFEPVARAFRNWAASSVLYNFTVYRSLSSFRGLFDYLRADDFAKLRALDLLDMSEADYLVPSHFEQMQQLIHAEDATEFLFCQYRASNAYVEELSVSDRSFAQARNSLCKSALQLGHALGHTALEALYRFRS